MKELIESKGGKVSGSVSAKTHYLLAGEGGGRDYHFLPVDRSSPCGFYRVKGWKTLDP